MQKLEALTAQALELSTEDRMHLADLLEVSLLGTDVAEAWSTELDRRLAAYDRDPSIARDASDLVDRVRKQLKDRRST